MHFKYLLNEAHAMTSPALDPNKLPEVLAVFYQRVRQDPELGPIFSRVIEDWDEHLARLEDFWSSLMLTTGRYKGNPLALHALHAHEITPVMFDRWLHLWIQTTTELLPVEVAQLMQIKAARIADRLKYVMYEPTHGGLHPSGISG
tara:strand:- start:943 stop:1380 length:438 start_codon:yes stop_codon:yes gene_type:complete